MADKPTETHSGLQPPSLTIDWECYASYLDGSDLSENQKRELIETLWNIVVSCVDLGFDLHPVQQACEQNSGNTPHLNADLLSFIEDNPNNQNENPADIAAQDSAEKEES
ncbi:hypothetical protein [uncultured Roseibium sp.]|uniref:hypothetical protein n=1 Tax=uncultured Roseibium sp. TaxID=1936171 RepID=UPI0026275794|nr:hypothetical protein [uncultured Roseibium sp.]